MQNPYFLAEKFKNYLAEILRTLPFIAQHPELLLPLSGGKFLRAQLIFSLSESFQSSASSPYPAAAAVELIHTATLLHDDLIDRGERRRGTPTVWKAHGTETAVLLGDWLMLQALEQLTLTHRIELISEFTQQLMRVCSAEILQEIETRPSPPDREEQWAICKTIAREKTGALFAFSAVSGAPKNSPKPLINALRESGFKVGTAYQLADDLIDTLDREETTGKSAGTDAARKKLTAASCPTQSRPNILNEINVLLAEATQLLTPWPNQQNAMGEYIARTIQPFLDSYFSAEK